MSTNVSAGPLAWFSNSALRGLILKKGLIVLSIAAGLTLLLTVLALATLSAAASQVSGLNLNVNTSASGTTSGLEIGVFLLIWSFVFFTAHLAPFTANLAIGGASVFGVGSLLITAVIVVAAYRAGAQIERLYPYSVTNGESMLRAASIAIPYWIGCLLLFVVSSIRAEAPAQFGSIAASVGPSLIGLFTPFLLVGGAAAIGARRHRGQSLSDSGRFAVRGVVLALFSIFTGIIVGLIGAILAGLIGLATHAASTASTPTYSTSPTPTFSTNGLNPGVIALGAVVALFFIPNALFFMWGSALGLHLSSEAWLILPFAIVGALLGALTLQPRADRTEQASFAVTFGVASFLLALISNPSSGAASLGGNPLVVLLVGLALGTGLAIVGPYAARTALGQSALAIPLMAGMLRRIPLPGEATEASPDLSAGTTSVPGWVSDPGTPGPGWDSRPSRPVPTSTSTGTATAVMAPPRQATVAQPMQLHFGKKARIATTGAVVVVVALIGLNIYLSSITTAAGAASAYEQAVGGNDTSAIWSHLAVQPLAAGVTAGQPGSTQLLSQNDLKAMLSLPQNSHQGRTSISVGTVTQNGDTAIVPVTYQQQGQTGSETLTLVRDPSQRAFLFYPVWKVALTPGVLTITPPFPQATFAIDGTQVASGTSVAYVFPGTHRVTLLPSGPYAATDVTTTVLAQNAAQAAFSNLRLTSAAQASAATAVNNYFTSCLQRTDASVAGCPQQLYEVVSSPVTWQLVGKPTDSLTVTVPTGCQAAAASGHFLMTASYTTDAGPAHRVSGGTYSLPLNWNGQGFDTQDQGGGCATNPPGPLSNPGANNASVLAAVLTGWQACLKATVLDPPDCPASAFGYQPSNIRWSSSTDPMSGAQVAWDGNAGVYKVSGNYSLVASYSSFGGDQSNPVNGSYTAYVTWDGQTAKLINIGSGQ